MKRSAIALITLISLLIFTTCNKEESPSPEPEPEPEPVEAMELEAIIENTPVDPDAIALEILEETNWEQTDFEREGEGWNPPGNLLSFDKTFLADGIAHYTFILKLGDGEHDKIGLHRIVRESGDGQPETSGTALLHLHGDGNQFATVMLPGVDAPGTPDDAGLSVYLARNGVDVWGIDQAWALVPAAVTDHSFMEDWGLDRQIRDSRIAAAIARILRFRTGSGLGKLFLSGHSSGATTGYALLNQEALLTPNLRHVKGFVPMDFPAGSNDETFIAGMLQRYEDVTALIESGTYAAAFPFQLIGNLATSDSNGDSPVIPGFTNRQAAIFIFAGRANPLSHFLAGTWDGPVPTGFQYVDTDQGLAIYFKTVPYQAARYQQDNALWLSEIEDAPWDDHFGDIEVPILSVDPAGGYGSLSEYGTSLLGSSDITHLDIQLQADGEEALDYGHIDIFLANNAEELVWRPILDWMETR